MLTEQINNNLILANDLTIDFLKKQTEYLIKKRVDFCDLYLQNNTHESWGLDEDVIKSGTFAVCQGIGVRAICHDKSFLSYSNSMNKNSIANLVNNLFVEPHHATNNTNPIISQDVLHDLYTKINPLYSLDNQKKINLLKDINQISRKLDFVTNVIANLSIEYDEICIVRSDNKILDDIRPLVHISITIIINKNNKMEKGHGGFGGRYLLNEISQETVDYHITEAHNQALLKIDAKDAPQGKLPVVLGSGWAGIILHEAIGHGLEGDFNRKGSSAFSGKINQQVAHSSVTVIDDGTIPNRRGSLNIDDEGNPTQKNILIENGILKGYLFDELNARLMNTKSTGNGRRESFAASPLPRMTNTYMLGGKYTHDEIISSVKHGIYATSFEGGQVDITSGKFVFNATVAWMIENGKVTYPIKGCALVGSGPECLKYVTMVGDNMALDSGIGTCGKDGQSVPVGVGQPTIRVDDGLVIGGG